MESKTKKNQEILEDANENWMHFERLIHKMTESELRALHQLTYQEEIDFYDKCLQYATKHNVKIENAPVKNILVEVKNE